MKLLFLCVEIISLTVAMMLQALAQPGAVPDTLACVTVKSEPIYYNGISMVDVALTNNCSDDITAIAVGRSDPAGSEPVNFADAKDLLPNLISMQPRLTTDPYLPMNLFRRGETIRWRVPVPNLAPKYLGEISVVAVVFWGRTAIGDTAAVDFILRFRKEVLEGLLAARNRLKITGDRASTKMLLRDRQASVDVGSRKESSAERSARLRIESIESYAPFAPSEENWREYLAGAAKHLDSSVDIFTKHSQLHNIDPSPNVK